MSHRNSHVRCVSETVRRNTDDNDDIVRGPLSSSARLDGQQLELAFALGDCAFAAQVGHLQ